MNHRINIYLLLTLSHYVFLSVTNQTAFALQLFQKKNARNGPIENSIPMVFDRRSMFHKTLSDAFLVSGTSASVFGFAANGNAMDDDKGREIRRVINQAVTESDLGISVRKSVVRGAQIMDKVDGSWEKFSDTFQLGTERSKREGRPPPKVIPKPLPLNVGIANEILRVSDEVFLSLVPSTSNALLMKEIDNVDNLVRKSFERAGLKFEQNKLGVSEENSIDDRDMSGPIFNYWSYVHYRAYCNILVQEKVDFMKFKKDFEMKLGYKVLNIMLPDFDSTYSTTDNETGDKAKTLKNALGKSLTLLDKSLEVFQSQGFVAIGERSKVEKDQIEDWSMDLSDLQFSVALDGDVTLNAQILLQEQGYRLIPDYGKYATTFILGDSLRVLPKSMMEEVSVEEYYMDTDYNSDPDKFEVKEVLLNIVIEST